MNMSSMLLTILAAVLIVWIALGMWRSAGFSLMQEIEQSYREYYAAHTGEGREMPPPVRWDYEQEGLVPIPQEDVRDIEGSGGLRAVGVATPQERAPIAAYGLVLARIPTVWFHGVFAVASLALTVLLVFKMRAG